MKLLILSLCALLSSLSFADDIRGSFVDSKEEVCESDLRAGNFMYDLQLVSETADEAVFTLKSQYGSCLGRSLEAYPVVVQRNQLQIFKQEVSMPWHKPLFESSVSALSENEVELTIKFYKKRLFASKSQRKFFVHFWVTSNIRFFWDFTVSEVKGEGLVMKITPVDHELVVR